MRDVTVAVRGRRARRGRSSPLCARSRTSTVDSVSDRTFLMHLGGKIEIAPKISVKTRDDLSMAYTPGVARVSAAIAADREKAWTLTIKGNIDRDRLRRLGGARPRRHRPARGDAGDGGQGAAVQGARRRRRLPALPRDPGRRQDRRVRAARSRRRSAASTSRTSPRRAASRSSGGCATSSTSPSSTTTSTAPRSSCSPRCSTRCASSASAPRTSASSIVGAGAAGVASSRDHPRARRARADRRATSTARLRRPAGARPVARGARGAHEPGAAARHGRRAARGRRRVVGVSGPRRDLARGGALDGAGRDRLRDGQPGAGDPARRRSRDDVAIMATGRSDYPNQINNVLAFPGVFRGALDVRASAINEEMKLAAAQRDRRRDRRRRAARRVHRPERLQPARGRGGRGGGRRGGGAQRRRAARPPRAAQVSSSDSASSPLAAAIARRPARRCRVRSASSTTASMSAASSSGLPASRSWSVDGLVLADALGARSRRSIETDGCAPTACGDVERLAPSSRPRAAASARAGRSGQRRAASARSAG